MPKYRRYKSTTASGKGLRLINKYEIKHTLDQVLVSKFTAGPMGISKVCVYVIHLSQSEDGNN